MINSLLPKKEFDSRIWDRDQKLDREVRKHLLQIALDYKNSIGLEDNDLQDKIKLVDVRFTGSLANYNWSEYSDIDLHLVFDFGGVLEEYKDFAKDLFQAKKAQWNTSHDVKIHGYDVEVYPEDIDEEHIASGLYSITKNDWLNAPSYEDADIDRDLIKKKVVGFLQILDLLESSDLSEDDRIRAIEYIQKRIKDMRQAGLSAEGEYSVENLTFKVLRRAKVLDRLSDMKIDIIDQGFSID